MNIFKNREYHTPEQVIPHEELLLSSDYDPLSSLHSIKGVHLEYLSDKDEDDNLHYIPFDLEKDEDVYSPKNENNENLDAQRNKFPSFHEFSSEDYELE